MVLRVIAPLVALAQGVLMRRSNPTRDWPTAVVSGLVYDMRSCRLNDIPFRAPIEAAKLLGRSDWFSGSLGDIQLDYRKLGLQVICPGSIAAFRVILQPISRRSARDRAFQAADLTLIAPSGSACRLWGCSNNQDLIAILGRPMDTATVAGDRVHSFVVDGNLLESVHDGITGQLLELRIQPARVEAAESAPPDEDVLEQSA